MNSKTPDTQKSTLAFRCVDLKARSDVDELIAMVDRSTDISFATFSKHVDWRPLAKSMGYVTEPGEPGLRLSNDYAVRFRSSTWKGERAYYMVHSAIEFVFRSQDPSKVLRPANPWRGVERVDTSVAEPAIAATPARRRPRP